jgi:hypothetical protein
VGKPVVPQKQVDGICVTVRVDMEIEVTVTQAEELDIIGRIDEVMFCVGVMEDDGAEVVFAVVGNDMVVEFMEGVAEGDWLPDLGWLFVDEENVLVEFALGVGMVEEAPDGRVW